MNTRDLKKLLDELCSLPKETEWVEFKENKYNPDEIGEYISALSNSACLLKKESGYLVFGVEDQTHRVKGTSFNPVKEKVGNEELENWLGRLLAPHTDFQILEFDYGGKAIVIFKIDPTHNIPIRFKGVEYIRVGSYKKKLKDYPEKERKIWAKTSRHIFEKDIAIKNIDDDKALLLLDYTSYFKLMGLNLPADKASILKKLEEERLIVNERGRYHITNFGAILFAADLRSFDKIARKAPRVIIYAGKDRLKTIKEHVGNKGYAAGFTELIDYINDKLPINEEIGRALRKEVKMYPETAVRELIANALIHQDFSETGTGPMIEIFESRVEISNPGKPLINPLRFIDHSPQSRNEILASFMRRVNICEERGSGIDKVITAVEDYQLPAPNFIAGDNFMRTILYAGKTLRQMDREDKRRACYQHCCLKYVSGEFMTNQTLRERFKIEEKNYPMASKIISDTIEAGLIKVYNLEQKSKRHAKYIPFWA